MDAIAIVILEVLHQNASEMPFTEDDDPVQTLSADATVQPFRVGILPRAVGRGQHFLDAHVLHATSEPTATYAVPVSKQIRRRCAPWEGLCYLLCRPCGGRMFGYIEMNNATPVDG